VRQVVNAASMNLRFIVCNMRRAQCVHLNNI
jgi:hypothetical protein